MMLWSLCQGMDSKMVGLLICPLSMKEGKVMAVGVTPLQKKTWYQYKYRKKIFINSTHYKRCQVLIVVGGWGRCDHGCTFLDTTEVFTPGSGPWRILAEALPSPMQGGYVATVSNTVYMFGRFKSIRGLNGFTSYLPILKVAMMALSHKMIYSNLIQMLKNGDMSVI